MFKNAMIYRIKARKVIPNLELLPDLLTNREFVPTSGLRASSFGWVSPLDGAVMVPVSGEVMASDGAESLAFIKDNLVLLKARHEKKVIPSSTLNEIVAEKIAKVEEQEDRKIRAKEKQSIRENAIAELLPRAMTSAKYTKGYLDLKARLLVIDTGSVNEAEMFINCIRDSLGSFSVTPLQVKAHPREVFTQWLMTQSTPEGISLGLECDVIDPHENSKVQCRNQELDTSEVRAHAEAGKLCKMIGLTFYGSVKISVDHDLVLRRIKSLGITEPEDDEDPTLKLETDLFLTRSCINEVLNILMKALGGEVGASDT